MQIKGLVTSLDESYDFGPEVIKIEAQFEEVPRSLLVIVEFTKQEVDFRASVLFKNLEGLRVLDEGDQLMFWEDENIPGEWLWEIKSGGWFDMERKNRGATMLSTISNELTEYIVTGVGMCVNVICSGAEQPIITLLD